MRGIDNGNPGSEAGSDDPDMGRLPASEEPNGCGQVLDFTRDGHFLEPSLALSVTPEIEPKALEAIFRESRGQCGIETAIVLLDQDAVREDNTGLRASLNRSIDPGKAHSVGGLEGHLLLGQTPSPSTTTGRRSASISKRMPPCLTASRSYEVALSQ